MNKGAESTFRVSDDLYIFYDSIFRKVFTQGLRNFLLIHIGGEAVRERKCIQSSSEATKYSREEVKFTYLATKTLALCGCLLSVRVPPAGEESTRD